MTCTVVAVAAGCGGDDDGGESVATVGPPSGGAPPCDEAKIGLDGSADTAEGVCKLEGKTLVVADKDHAVDTGEMRVRLRGWEIEDEVVEEHEFGSNKTSPIEKTDTWVFADVEVENQTDTTGKAGNGWVIRVGSREDTYGINELVDVKGSLSVDDKIEPGESVSGNLVFEMPKTLADELETKASLFAYDFSDGREFEKNTFHQPKLAGVVRMYR